MEYIHHSSIPATKSELELFNIPPTQTAIESSYEVQYRPTATLDSTRHYDFIIPPSDDFTDLSASMVYIRAKVLNSDMSDLAENSDITPVNNFGNALFEQVGFYLAGVNINTSNSLHNFQSFFEDLLFGQPNPIDQGGLIASKSERKS